MNKNPLVSIIIPVYKGANYLAEAIDSALAQTYKNIEIIVVNDGSPDNGETEKVALSYGNRIHYIYQKNGGVSSALNTGIREMKGEYFSWLSHDDLYESTKIEKQVSLIQTENDIILCSGYLIDENKKLMPRHIETLKGRFSGAQLLSKKISGFNEYNLNGLGFLIPRHVFDRVGGFDETMRYLQDLDMWLRIMMVEKYCFVCHRDLLVMTRIHRNQQTNTISDVFNVDRKNMVIKLFNLLKSDERIQNKDIWYKLYYKMFARGHNKFGEKVFSEKLKKEGFSDIHLFLMSFPFYLNGTIKILLRYIYDAYLKLKNIRS